MKFGRAIVFFLGLAAATGLAQPRPDVVFVAIDDMNDWITLLDPEAPISTPNLQRLASRGVLFRRAYTASPACNPSRTAVLTGLAPTTTGVYSNTARWRTALPKALTLPELFKREGYWVSGAGKIYHHAQGGAFHDLTAFHEFLAPTWPLDVPMPPQKLNGLSGYGTLNNDWGVWPKGSEDTPDSRTVSWCVERLRNPPERPLFLACGIFRPHMPFFVPRSALSAYPENNVVMPRIRSDDLADIPAGAALDNGRARRFWTTMMAAEKSHPGSWRSAVRFYQAAAGYADAQVGRLLDVLESTPRGRDTIVVLWSDHGYQLGEKQSWEKFTLWEKATRVPLVIVAPGHAPAAGVCERPVSLLDLYPTLAELCGFGNLPSLDGESLTALLRDPAAERARPALMTYMRGNHAVRSGRWRYIRYATGEEELYDHDRDPHEWNNLAGKPGFASVVQSLVRWLPANEAQPVEESMRR